MANGLSDIFKEELKIISDKSIVEMLKYILDNRVPEYFLTNHSSSSGKYHPLNKNGEQENLIEHTKSVFRMLLEILNHPDLKAKFEQRDISIVLAAALLHDSVKYGYPDIFDHTVHDHPILVKLLLDDIILNNSQWVSDFNAICNLISTHHGPWRASIYSTVVLPQISNDLQWYLHLSDYLASREFIRVDYDYIPQIR